MSKQRLIDATKLRRIFDVWLSEMNDNDPEDQQTGTAIYDCACQLDDAPTIDPETMPIVRELREKLKQVTEERDAAVSDMKNFTVDWWENGNGFPCKYCKHQLSNGNCEWKMLYNGSDMCLAHNFVWRGPDGDHHD